MPGRGVRLRRPRLSLCNKSLCLRKRLTSLPGIRQATLFRLGGLGLGASVPLSAPAGGKAGFARGEFRTSLGLLDEIRLTSLRPPSARGCALPLGRVGALGLALCPATWRLPTSLRPPSARGCALLAWTLCGEVGCTCVGAWLQSLLYLFQGGVEFPTGGNRWIIPTRVRDPDRRVSPAQARAVQVDSGASPGPTVKVRMEEAGG